MTARGKTTPASTGGSFRPHAGERSRATPHDSALDEIAGIYQQALHHWTGPEHDALETQATGQLVTWIADHPEAVDTIARAVNDLTAHGRAEHAAHARLITEALAATHPDTGMHPSTRRAALRQALTETADNDNWTGARDIMSLTTTARQHLAYHQEQATDYQPPLHEIVRAIEHEPAFADLAGHTLPLAQAIRSHIAAATVKPTC